MNCFLESSEVVADSVARATVLHGDALDPDLFEEAGIADPFGAAELPEQALMAGFTASCGADLQLRVAVCGNGSCDAGETALSCPVDCDRQGAGGAGMGGSWSGES